MVMLHLFTFDPAWIRPLHHQRTERIFYDGFCGLCHRAVRLVLAEDTRDAAFRMATLQSDTFERSVPEDKRADLPDTVVVQREDGALLVRSAALLYILARLGGYWRVSSFILRAVPDAVIDAGCDFITRIRHRIFAKPTPACPTVPPHLRARFDP
jgi:predicted DCC family thiol-disulfide oxidoreductase YuxK